MTKTQLKILEAKNRSTHMKGVARYLLAFKILMLEVIVAFHKIGSHLVLGKHQTFEKFATRNEHGVITDSFTEHERFHKISVSSATLVVAISVVYVLAGVFAPSSTKIHAASLVVTDNGDAGDGTCDSSCTLRDAILNANANVGIDAISFNAAMTITLASPLPALTETASIDGDVDANGTPDVILDGTSAGAGDGIAIQSDDVTVSGLVIQNFTGNGVSIQGSGNTVANNYIGTNSSATAAAANTGAGVIITDDTINPSQNNVIGGNTATTRNVISGNTAQGIKLVGSLVENNTISGNNIGVNVTGTAAVANGSYGIWLTTGTNNNTIGGTNAGITCVGICNLLSGNTDVEIRIDGAATANSVQGNFIGTVLDGSRPISWNHDGVGIDVAGGAYSNTIGGNRNSAVAEIGQGNLISGFVHDSDANGSVESGEAIVIETDGYDSGSSAGNEIYGNLIGTNPSGVNLDAYNNTSGAASSDGLNDLRNYTGIDAQASFTIIGDGTASHRNILAGNVINVGVQSTTGLDGASVYGNYVGVTKSGNTAQTFPGYTHPGGTSLYYDINVFGTTNLVIRDNVIAGVPRVSSASTTGFGLYFGNPGIGNSSTNNTNVTVAGNKFGTDSTGSAALTNYESITCFQLENSTIGGALAADRNIISGSGFNTNGGPISGDSNLCHDNTIQNNYIGTDSTGNLAIANSNGVHFSNSAYNMNIADNIFGEASPLGLTQAHDFSITGNQFSVSADLNTDFSNSATAMVNIDQSYTVTYNSNICAADHCIYVKNSHDVDVTNNAFGTDLTHTKSYGISEAIATTNDWDVNVTGNYIKNVQTGPIHKYLVTNAPYAYAGNDYDEIIGSGAFSCDVGQSGLQTVYYVPAYGKLYYGTICNSAQMYSELTYLEPTPLTATDIKAYLITVSGKHTTFLVAQATGSAITCSLMATIVGGTCDTSFTAFTQSGTDYVANTLPGTISVVAGHANPQMTDYLTPAAISVMGANNNTVIQNNEIVSNNARGILALGGEGAMIDGNNVTDGTGNGIVLEATTGSTVTNNTITNSHEIGIELIESTLNTIGGVGVGNTISDENVYGIALKNSSDQNTVTTNDAHDNGNVGTVTGSGLYVYESLGNQVYNNTFNQNVYGVILDSDSAETSGNIIGGNGAGEPNTINQNAAAGVVIRDAMTQTNNLVGNTISSNGTYGVENIDTHDATGSLAGGDNAIVGNDITLNTLSGVRNYGSSPTVHDNTISQNSEHGIKNLADYGSNTDPSTASDDLLSEPAIYSNTINTNATYGVYSLDTAPTNKSTLATDNTFDNGNTQGRVRQEWYGLVDVTTEGAAQDAATVSVKNSAEDQTLASITSAATGFAPNAASLTDVQTWQVIPEFQVSPTGTLQEFGPHKITAEAVDDSEMVAFDYNGINDSGEVGPSGFGNINGRYQVALVNITTLPNTVSGVVYNDANENGSKDSGENGMSGLTVSLYASSDTTFGSDTISATTTTVGDGTYTFSGVIRGNYFVVLSKPTGYDETTSNPGNVVTFAAEDETATRDFGVAAIPVVTVPSGTIRGTVYEDANSNKTFDSSEKIVSGVVINLYADTNGNGSYDSGTDQFLTSRTTNSSGVYRFIGIHLRNYFLRIDVPSNRSLTTENSPTDLLVLDTDGKTIAENFGLSQATATPEPEPEPEPNPRPKPGVGGGVISIINDITGGSVPGIVAPRTGASNVNSLIAIAAAGLAIVNFLLAAGSSFPMLLRLLLDLFTEPLMALFGSKKQPWGKVFDSITNLPIDLGIVRLYDANTMKLTATAVTDRTGRFKFFPKKGFYVAKADKLGYVFPSSLLKSAPTYQKPNYYFGEKFTISDMDQTFNRDIPIDRDNAEDGEKVLLKLRSKQALHTVFAYSGIVISIVNMIILLSWLTFGFFVLHVLLFLFFWRITRPRKPKAWGIVYDEETKKPIPGAIVRIFDQRFGRLLDAAISNRNGKFGFLIGPSTYYLSIEAKGYIFPGTRKSSHKDYIGGSIEIKDANQVISYDIPLKKRPE